MELILKSVKTIIQEGQRVEWYQLNKGLQVEVQWTWWEAEEDNHPLMELNFFILNEDNFPLGTLKILCLNPQTVPLLNLDDFTKDEWIMLCEDYHFNYQAAPTFTSAELRKQAVNAYLDEVYVAPDYRNQGIATQLIEFAKLYLNRHQLSKGILTYPFAVEAKEDVAQTHRVQQLYARLGFEPWQTPYYCFSY